LNQIAEEKKVQQAKIVYSQCKYRGTLFDTYLLYELCDDVYIIDQHAAHERLIYDGLRKKLNQRSLAKQGLLVPYIFGVTPEEQQFVEENMATIWQMGFTVEPFGDKSYRVNEVPADLPNINIKEFFNELLANVHELKSVTLVDILKDKIAQTACKHAVKGGDILTEQERDKLFEMLQGDMGLKCPHGRPVCVKMSKSEIEKMFKRKV
ncbi:MAG: DNA mismatch repair protein MutL, partial [Clostridia bacterium]|nr:DNA mismatch repair protein MutL [Clostridia bacterium]